MLKLGVAAVGVVALGVFFLHRGGDSKAAKVSSCLEKAGASVQASTFFEDSLTSAAAQEGGPAPEFARNAFRELDRRIYDVTFADGTAFLFVARSGHEAAAFESRLSETGAAYGTMPVQRVGNVLVLWPQTPSAATSATVEHCLG